MTGMLFPFWRLLRGDAWLTRFSASPQALAEDLAGKRVSIVGNARSLSGTAFGAEIDRGDIVIRMHKAPLVTAQSHGTHTDWLALAMPVEQELIAARGPSRLLWMAKKRKRVRQRFVTAPGFYLHPVAEWDRMAAELGAPPTTGVMLIDLVARSQAEEIHLFGFDFFASLSLSGRRTAAQVPHDFAAEKAWVEALIARDDRVVLHRAAD